jgi:hypothetical protein
MNDEELNVAEQEIEGLMLQHSNSLRWIWLNKFGNLWQAKALMDSTGVTLEEAVDDLMTR